jgi:hypothetical protein
MNKRSAIKLESIIDYLEKHDVEIVSYGLAPNPNGFCYEVSDLAHCDKLDDMLSDLTSSEENDLRNYVFGGEYE